MNVVYIIYMNTFHMIPYNIHSMHDTRFKIGLSLVWKFISDS